MRDETIRRAGMGALWALILAAPGLAQHREYCIRGRVLDTLKREALAGRKKIVCPHHESRRCNGGKVLG